MKKIGKKKILGIALLTSLSIFAGTTANNITRTATTTNNTVNDECRPPHKLQKDSNGNLVDENGNMKECRKTPYENKRFTGCSGSKYDIRGRICTYKDY